MKRHYPILIWLIAIVAIATLLFILPGRDEIAPVVKGDNCYIFLAVDRFCEGNGITTLYPLAPEQPWEWRADWAFLTQWPPAYPVMLAGIRMLTGVSTLQAAQGLAIFFCAISMVGWFALAKHLVKDSGIPGILLAGLVAVSSIATWMLINPGTDLLLHGTIPWLLLLVIILSERQHSPSKKTDQSDTSPYIPWLLIGLLAGSLVWIRYMAIYVPVGIGVYITIEWMIRRMVRFRIVLLYACASLLPIFALGYLNHIAGLKVPEQERYNLGGSLGTVWDPDVFITIWKQFTTFPIYNYHAISQWIFLLGIPIGIAGFVLLKKDWRETTKQFLSTRGTILCLSILVTLFVILAATSMLFRAKHTYVGIDRYYISAQPLYFLLFLGPLVCLRSRVLRVLACIPILLFAHWYIAIEWPRPFDRWHAAQRPTTQYGRWADAFQPGETALYDWLKKQEADNLVIFSNFHSDIALETGIPAIPTPQSLDQMNRWLLDIQKTRKCGSLRVLFAVPENNGTGNYYLPSRNSVIDNFCLTPSLTAPDALQKYVFELKDDRHNPDAMACDASTSPSPRVPIIPQMSSSPE